MQTASQEHSQVSEATRKAQEESHRKFEEAQAHARTEALKDNMTLFQPPRPVIVSRTETSITLNLAKRTSGSSVRSRPLLEKFVLSVLLLLTNCTASERYKDKREMTTCSFPVHCDFDETDRNVL